MKSRREAQSSSLSFIDCICCGFGAVLLLFILTAKNQITLSSEETRQSLAAAETLQQAIEAAQAENQALSREVEALAPQADTTATRLSELAAKQERLTQAIEAQQAALRSLDTETPTPEAPAARERPSADQSYLSGLSLRGPKAVILLETSGSMLAENAGEALTILQNGSWQQSEKWRRARNALKAVLAAIPKGTEVAVLQMAESTSALSGSPANPYIDPYDNTALLQLLDRLERLEARGGADLAAGFQAVNNLQVRASSLLLIADGLPSAPAPPGRALSEADRVRLFNQARTRRPNVPFNALLLPFDGDPSAAGLYWQLSTQSGGVTLVPGSEWPKL